jgi:hypothetical protein
MIPVAVLAYFTKGALLGALGKVWKGFCDFISTPIGAALVAAVVAYGLGDMHGHRVTNAAWQTKWHDAEVEAERQRLARDALIKAKIEADANQRLEALATRKAELEKMVKDYEDQEANRPTTGGAAPELTDDSDARWLHDAQQKRAHVKPQARRGLAERLRTIGR